MSRRERGTNPTRTHAARPGRRYCFDDAVEASRAQAAVRPSAAPSSARRAPGRPLPAAVRAVRADAVAPAAAVADPLTVGMAERETNPGCDQPQGLRGGPSPL